MLNEKALTIYNCIKEMSEGGVPPSVREICKALNIKSTSTVHRYIELLKDEGYIEKEENKNRSIKLSGAEFKSVPVIGTVAAGMPITAIEDITDYISFKPNRNYDNELFALKIKGESMINIGILDGDTVIVEKTSYAENGDIVIALTDDCEATCKTFYKEKGFYRLQPENDTMDPIILDSVQILGKVVALTRYFD